MDADPTLVPDRSCGPCTACCTVLTIDQPELQKLPGESCPNCIVGKGCGVYETRGAICRNWFCGWRKLKWISPKLRPDISGVLVRLGHEPIPPPFKGDATIEFGMLRPEALAADGLAESVAASVHANFATFLVAVPRETGVTSTRLLLNDALRRPVASRNKAAVLRVLRTMLERGLRAEHKPVVLTRRPPPETKAAGAPDQA